MPEARTCTKCQRALPLDQYYKKVSWCKDCHRDYTREYRKRTGLKVNAYLKSLSPEERSKVWRRDNIARYGITLDHFNEMLARQGGCCAICGTTVSNGGKGAKSLAVDHDHSCCAKAHRSCGKCVRGLLCGNCNRGLGQLGDDPDRVEAAARYLRQYARTVD